MWNSYPTKLLTSSLIKGIRNMELIKTEEEKNILIKSLSQTLINTKDDKNFEIVLMMLNRVINTAIK